MALKTKLSLLNKRLLIQVGDITQSDSEAIVNAANSSLLGGGGVDGAIHEAAGPKLLAACRKIRQTLYPQGLPPGQAVITDGFRLKARYVIHTVGPIYNPLSKAEQEAQLASCYKQSLLLALKNGLHSIAFPAISTGAYGYPKKEAAQIVFQTLKEYLSNNSLPKLIYLVFFQEADAQLFVETISDVK